MYLIGFVFYLLISISYYFVSEINEIINQSYLLAQALTIMMGFIYIYPLVIFLFICLCSLKTEKYKKLIVSQTKLAASVSVSLGLIGTFQGLTAMVSSIAKSMGGSSDMAEKMNSMLNAISSALSAMSYAFLTSILGVAVSVLLLLSLNFWVFYFKSNIERKTKERTVKVTYDQQIEIHLTALNDKLERQFQLEKKMLKVNQKICLVLPEILQDIKFLQQQLSDSERFRNKEVATIKKEVLQFKDKIQKLLENFIK
ncbi:hypothetical protein AHS81_23890 [Salmonella enterica]|nr:hypothetical protein [Salmonella enterica]EAP0276242.1 hypothetical protein [Salmonella enterica]EAS2604972.1 hypothetical protein [Salmonella enterica]